MEVTIDLRDVSTALRDPEDMERFNVRVLGADDGDRIQSLAAVLCEQSIGRLGNQGEVFVDPGAVRRLAVETLADGRLARWEEGLSGMLGYASSKGWIADDGAVRAHIEWGEEPGL